MDSIPTVSTETVSEEYSIYGLIIMVMQSLFYNYFVLGLIFALTGGFLAKVTFLHTDDDVAKKQSLVIFLLGPLLIVVQPYFSIFEVSLL